MNSFFSNYIPSLLLFDAGTLYQLFGLLFIVVFFLLFIFFSRKYTLFGKAGEEKTNQRRYIFPTVALCFVLLFGTAFWIRQGQLESVQMVQENDDGYVLVSGGEEGFAVTGDGTNEEGKVLGEADTAQSSVPIPKSENFRIGSIAVGGDNQMYLANTEDKKLDLLAIGYKTVIDENRENTGAIIRWETNKPSRGEVLYRKSSDTEFRSAKEDSFGWEHTIVLEKLGYSSTYIFLISANDKWGNTAKSENYALYSGSNSPSLFDLLAGAFGDIFGWAMKK